VSACSLFLVVLCLVASSAAWTEEGKLFMWGRGEEGQLGLGDTENWHNASLVSAAVLEGEAVTQVALGGRHTLIACRSGRLFSWGGNRYGQLGNGRSGSFSDDRSTNETRPVEVVVGTGEERVVSVAAGLRYSLVLTSSGKVFGFGYNGRGQLGLGSSETFFSTPQWVKKLPGGVAEIAAGMEHSFVRVDDGRVFSFGYNLEGRLGLGHTSEQREPVEVAGVRAERLWKGGSGSSFSLLMTEGGVVGAGWNGEGQLGLGGGGSFSRSELSFVPMLALDVDECAVIAATGGHCDARAICRDTVGSFVCECPHRSSSSGDGTLCVGAPSLVA